MAKLKRIKLTQGQYTIVDEEDYERVNRYKWYANFRNRKCFIAVRGARIDISQKAIYMHRFIMNASDGVMIDHINHNTLDNRKRNLRLCTNQENQFNSRKLFNSTSVYKGVEKIRENTWRVRVAMKNGERKYIGNFKNEKEAALAYNKMALKYQGIFAYLNKI